MTSTETQQTPSSAEVMIGLKNLVKCFPGSDEPSVDNLSMEIRTGELVMFVGPSGCGKTTTMKMVNRIIEPSSGEIFLEGENVSKVNPDHLRRRIGYVIQQIGLFPHMTIADNIAVVPKMLGWDKARIDARIDELLETVSIPASYRERYPKALSGGQRQRVGVARAMAADPPVLLMDEPFGAIDPITRDRLQNEFLRLQKQIHKTIVFVTHDIDEAVKLGDRIAILREQSRIAQFDTPENILTRPANDYVREFIGSGAMLKHLSLLHAGNISAAEWPVGTLGEATSTLRARAEQSSRGWLLLLDTDRHPLRWVPTNELEGETTRDSGQPVRCILQSQTSLYDTLDAMMSSTVGCATITHDDGTLDRVIDFEAVRQASTSAGSQAASDEAPGDAS